MSVHANNKVNCKIYFSISIITYNYAFCTRNLALLTVVIIIPFFISVFTMFRVCILLVLLVPVLSDEPGIILTGGVHFNELVRDVNNKVSKNTLLIIYHNHCAPEVKHANFSIKPHFVCFLVYTMATT